MILTFGLGAALMLDALWMPLSVVIIVYYAGSILLLGGTPGLRLSTTERRPSKKSSGSGSRRWIWSSASRSLRSRLAAGRYGEITIGEIDAESPAIERVRV